LYLAITLFLAYKTFEVTSHYLPERTKDEHEKLSNARAFARALLGRPVSIRQLNEYRTCFKLDQDHPSSSQG